MCESKFLLIACDTHLAKENKSTNVFLFFPLKPFAEIVNR